MKNLEHIAIIPDGNRRWAKKNKLDFILGHKKGTEILRQLLDWAKEFDIPIISIWGFSTENFNRDEKEIEFLFNLFNEKIDEYLKEYNKHKAKIRFIGNRSKFSKEFFEKIEKVETLTKDNKGFQLNILLNYGGRAEILKVVNELKNTNEEITEKLIENHLYTKGIPDPDLIIRTSGERRLSGLMPWQSVYSELYFVDKLWPDFTKEDFKKAIEEYEKRKRRFGK
ncbi:di-trans,poly-cis-decaprenylcistransferase [Candidatus Micrarchaeota archaeon]|nr:di-trans,poly-cis-decaprenylcistransferase [Candidatus Micrarchaeota archaeon]